mmetsp:Transcript_15913/g.24568  ORF Transcript_15913/g.24568 Transcript_15913/m.24568 type:complete len:85 (-) Transcript_15913:2129-2383(-)
MQNSNMDEVFRQRMKLGMEIKYLEKKLVTDAKSKFRYIMGHDKKEVSPGLFAQDLKVTKNIHNRIIIPSERITKCQREVKALHD